jgi:O-antigen/teichoic acid export membrane protein
MKSTAPPSWLKSGSYSLLSYGMQMGLGFIAFLLLIRLMPEREFGVWVLFLTMTSFADMGRLGLTQNAIIKFCVEQRTATGSVLTTGLLLNTLCSFVLTALLLLLSGPLGSLWSAPELTSLLWWYLPYALLEGTARYLDFAHIAHHDFRGVFWSKTAYGISLLLGIGLLWHAYGQAPLHWLPIVQVAASVPSLLTNSFYMPQRWQWGRPSLEWMGRLFHFGKYVLGTNFSSMFFNKMDIMMVGAFLTPAAVAMYNIATRITNYMEVPMTGIAQSVYPRIAGANAKGGGASVAALYERAVGLLMATLLPLALVVLLLSRPLVVLLAGEQYAEAAPLLNILIVAMLAKPWARLFGITLDAIGRPRLNFSLLLASLAVNVVFNLLLIPRLGMAGAAYASWLSIWGIAIAGQLIISRILPISQRNIWRQVWAFYRRPIRQLKLSTSTTTQD